MRRISIVAVMVWVLVLGVLASAPVLAQDKRVSRERAALRQMQQMVQQLRQETDTLGARLAAAAQENQALATERDRLARAVRGSQARGRQEQVQREELQARRAALEQELRAVTTQREGLLAERQAQDKALAQLREQLAGLQAAVTRVDSERQQLAGTLAARERGLASCEDNNLQLYRHGRELIEQCRDRSATDTVLRLEPFTGIGRVAIENLLQEYRDKLDAQKLQPRAP